MMHSVARLKRSADAALRRAYGQVVTHWRDYSATGRAIAEKRAATDRLLDEVARNTPYCFDGTVLVDGMWDNPNYWLRFSLLRGALGLAHANEVGVLGEFRRRHCRATFERLGIRAIESFPDLPAPAGIARRSAELVQRTKSADDILGWDLPEGVHPAIVYDGILKRQRLASVDIHDPQFADHVGAALTAIDRGRQLLDRHRVDLVVITHPLNFTYGALAWQALARGIPVVLPFGAFGTLRFTRFSQPTDLFSYHDRPDGADIDGLSSQKAEALAELGRRYLAHRLDGLTGDLPSQYAFQRYRGYVDRELLCRHFGWNPQKPIVAFYAANWYDWPHQLGMTQFSDFLDWTSTTHEVARNNDRVNWLFKPHPAEEWFGGISLAEVFSRFGNVPHIGLADKAWNNTRIQQSIDALITYHGTAGIEFAASGKPVLVPDRGNYDGCGFVKVARSREHYLDLLSSEWWNDIELGDARRRAEIFAGWWFCMPEWQGSFVLGDDARQNALYDLIPDLVNKNRMTVDRELREIREWWDSGERYYHTRKMANAERYRLSNISGGNPAPTETGR